jgi:hypothetical protein
MPSDPNTAPSTPHGEQDDSRLYARPDAAAWPDGGCTMRIYFQSDIDWRDAEIERLRAANAALRENVRMWARAAGAIFEDVSNG